jgi:ComF family protein
MSLPQDFVVGQFPGRQGGCQLMRDRTVDGVRAVLQAFIPPRCALCHDALGGGEICERCADSLPWILHPCPGCAMPVADGSVPFCVSCARGGPPFDRAWAAFRLEAPIQRLVHEVKYEANFGAARMLGLLAARRLASRSEPLPALLIAVPLHARRLRTRGYNQATQVARAMQELLGIPLGASDLATRRRATSDQIGQTAAQRRRNLEGAFEIRQKLSGTIALVDDVMTTGATLASLARACQAAGASRVEAWAIARAM